MDSYKHFSHNHNLSFHQVQHGAQYRCSGCNSQIKGLAFVCWQCGFHLHEECFRAKRSINHPSHPAHPLSLFPYPTYESGSFVCKFCGSNGTGFSYSCCHCNFDLHVWCASLPTTIANASNSSAYLGAAASDTPALAHQPSNIIVSEDGSEAGKIARIIQHKSHPEHPLTLFSSPPYEGGMFMCNACGGNGREKAYHCATCQFDLHVDCSSSEWDETVRRCDHKHPLGLFFSLPSGGQGVKFICDVCCAEIPSSCWLYYCSECDYGTHLSCAKAEVRPEIQAANKAREDQKEHMKYEMMKQIYQSRRDMINKSAYNGPSIVYL